MSTGDLLFYLAPLVLAGYAYSKGSDTLRRGLKRWAEQLAKILPTMTCALIAAGFLAAVIPDQVIARFLGDESPLIAVLVGSVTGVLIPAGPVVAFSIAASFAVAGASTAALVAFVTSWTMFALHRMVIYEVPLLGASFVKVRVLSVLMLPMLAGFIVILLDPLVRWLAGSG